MNRTRIFLGSLGAVALAASALGAGSARAQAQEEEHPRSYYPTLVRADLAPCRAQLAAAQADVIRDYRADAASYAPGGEDYHAGDQNDARNFRIITDEANKYAAMDPLAFYAGGLHGDGTAYGGLESINQYADEEGYGNVLKGLTQGGEPRPPEAEGLPYSDFGISAAHYYAGETCVAKVWMARFAAMHPPARKVAVANPPAPKPAAAASPALAESARAAGAAGNHTGAILHYGEALARDPGNPTYLVERGIQYQLLGQRDAAIRDFAAAIAAHPDYASAYYYRAGAYQEAGETRLAFADAAKALQLAPGDAGVRARHQALRSALAAPPPAAPGYSAEQVLSVTQISDCTNEAIAAQRRSQTGPGDPQKRIGEMALYQKFLFTHQCAGHPDAAKYIANADAMIASTRIAEVPSAAAAGAPKSPNIYDTPEQYVAAIQRGEVPMPAGMAIRNGVLVNAVNASASQGTPVSAGGASCLTVQNLGGKRLKGTFVNNGSQYFERYDYTMANSCSTPIWVSIRYGGGTESIYLKGSASQNWFCTVGFYGNRDCPGGEISWVVKNGN